MIELKYKSWHELPISKYFQITELSGDNLVIQRLAILCDEDEETLMSAPISTILSLNNQTKWLFEKMNIRKVDKVKIDGITYIVTKDPKDITTAQYIDFDLLKEDVVKYYANIIATILVPQGKTYGKDYSQFDLAETLKEKLDIETAESINFFFAKLLRKSTTKALKQWIKVTAKILLKTKDIRIKEMMTEQMKNLVKEKDNIDGLIWWT